MNETRLLDASSGDVAMEELAGAPFSACSLLPESADLKLLRRCAMVIRATGVYAAGTELASLRFFEIRVHT